MQNAAQRPMGVTILAVLAIIGGVLGIIGSLVLFGLGGVASTLNGGVGVQTMLLAILGLVQAVLSLAFGIGALSLQPWAWTLGVIAEALSIVLTVVAMIITGIGANYIISLAIAAVILYYLFTPEVKRAFGRA